MKPPNPNDQYADLFLVPLSLGVWNEFVSWYERRQVKPHLRPFRPIEGIWVAQSTPKGPLLVCGICIYPTDGPFAVAEYFSVNPDAPGRLAAGAMRVAAIAINQYAQTSGRRVLCAPNFLSGAKALKRVGFMESEGLLLHSMPAMFAARVLETRAVRARLETGRPLHKKPPAIAPQMPPAERPADEPLPAAPPRKRGKKR